MEKNNKIEKMYSFNLINYIVKYIIVITSDYKTNRILVISNEIKRRSCWKTNYQTAKRLYSWLIEQYGNSLDLNKEEGQLLRTMKPRYYFTFVEYMNSLN